MRPQRTLRNPMTLRGMGLHSGKDVTLVMKPAEPDSGIVFVRTDLPGAPRLPLSHQHAEKRDRQSALKMGEAEVGTVEHLAAAFYACGVHNVVVDIDAPEVPAMDGSAVAFVEAIREAGRIDQKAERRVLVLDRHLAVVEGEGTLSAFPCNGKLDLSYTLDYSDAAPWLRPQHVAVSINEERFAKEVAPARTFCLASEAQKLREAGFGKGADARNTLVLGPEGVLDNAFRFEDEPARHKMLDLVGDLSMLGADLEAKVVAVKTGHKANLELVTQLRERMAVAEIDGTAETASSIDSKEIMRILPHRYPFLFIDRVISVEGAKRAVAVKNVSVNEPVFQGHWPEDPVFPGVLQVEALAQLAGVLLMRKLSHTGKRAMIVAIEHVKFRAVVRPGDQLRLECETLEDRGGYAKVYGKAMVNNKITSAATLKFLLVKA